MFLAIFVDEYMYTTYTLYVLVNDTSMYGPVYTIHEYDTYLYIHLVHANIYYNHWVYSAHA